MIGIRIIDIEIERGPCFIKKGPVCECGYHQWIIKPYAAVCSNCGTEREGHFTGYISENGPVCECGYHQWFVSSEHWVCSNCGQSR